MTAVRSRRRRVFVGRAAEIDTILAASTSIDEPPVLRVSGPAGIGKTALLVAIEAECAARGIASHRFDLAREEISRDAVERAIAELVAKSNGAGRSVLLVDDVQAAKSLEHWLAGRLGAAGEIPLTVLADRRAMSHVWFGGGAARVAEMVLRPLSMPEVDLLLASESIEPTRRESIWRFSMGHPLLVTLATTVAGAWDDEDIDAKVLLPVSQALGALCDAPEKRSALAVVASADVISCDLLMQVLGDEATAASTFRWLSELHWLDETPQGLVPQPLMRRACAAYLKTHHPKLAQTTHVALASLGRRRRPSVAPPPLLPHEDHPSSEVVDADDGWAQTHAMPTGYFPPERTTAVLRLSRVATWDPGSDGSGALETSTASASGTAAATAAGGSFRELLQLRLDELARQANLTDREREVFQLLVLGRNTNEIGMVLGITARTAKFHQQRILEKIGADGRADILRVLL